MELQLYDDPHRFSEAITPYLVQHEAENNLILGILNSLSSQPLSGKQPPYLGLVRRGDEVMAAAVRTPPKNLVLSQGTEATCQLLAADLLARGESLPGVLGPQPVAELFAAAWCEGTDQVSRPGMKMRIYQLEAVNPQPPAAGEFRLASQADRDLLMRWFQAFNGEALEETASSEQARRWVEARLEDEGRGLALWWDRDPVSMAGYTGPTPHGIRVNAVYTPPRLRRRGYATALVAALSQHLLESGYRRCFLFTDLNNPTSNSIYRKIGYEDVCEMRLYRFGPQPPAWPEH